MVRFYLENTLPDCNRVICLYCVAAPNFRIAAVRELLSNKTGTQEAVGENIYIGHPRGVCWSDYRCVLRVIVRIEIIKIVTMDETNKNLAATSRAFVWYNY